VFSTPVEVPSFNAKALAPRLTNLPSIAFANSLVIANAVEGTLEIEKEKDSLGPANKELIPRWLNPEYYFRGAFLEIRIYPPSPPSIIPL